MEREKKRLQIYRRLIGNNPALLSAIDQIVSENADLPQDELLYLHTMAPVIMEFAEWVLQQAVRHGKERLYFLARDAYPVYLAAQRLSAARKLHIDCRYLKVSRYALRMGEYRLLGDRCTDRICIGGIRVTLRKILARAGLEELTETIARRLGMTGEEDRVLSYREITELNPRLRSCDIFQREIKRVSDSAFPMVMGYLKQEGLLNRVPYGLVDSGWVGTLQQTMENLLRTERSNLRLEGYYFGLYELPGNADPENYHSFYFSPQNGLQRKITFSNCLFETLCSAPHGMTVAYKLSEQGEYIAAEDGKGLNSEFIERYCELIDRFAEIYSRKSMFSADKSLTEAILKTLMGTPQLWEVKAFGTLLFCDDVLERTIQQVAAPLTDSEIRQQHFLSKMAIMLGLKKGEIHESAWIEGSIIRCGKSVKKNLKHARRYKTFVYVRKMVKNSIRSQLLQK